VKVLLINPPQFFYPGSDLPAGNLPLGLMYIAAVLEKGGHKVEILDTFMRATSFWKTGDKVYAGMPFKDIMQEIEQRKPDIVGVANPFTSQVENAIKVCDIVKRVDHGILTVVGGPHVSAAPEEFLKEANNADIVAIGEGEYTMLEIANCLESKMQFAKVQGIAYRRGKVVVKTGLRPLIENLDELPYPAYHLVDMEKYLNPEKIEYRSFKDRSISMITSRGCPFNCCFCSVHLHMGKKFRAHAVDYVVNHVDYVVKQFRVKTIFFEDDNLTLDTRRFESICSKMIEKRIKVKWETPNGVRVDCLTPSLLEKMQRAGCQSVFFGVESGDQKILDNIIGKNLKLKDVVRVAKTCKAIGLKTGAFYIIGFPGEKRENMLRTVDFALRLEKEYGVGIHLFFATPSVGTRLYEQCMQKGYIKKDSSFRAFAEARQARGMPMIETDDFSSTEVKEIAVDAVRRHKKMNLYYHIKNPRKTLETALSQPEIVLKFVKSLSST
jgi:anaerobic magnesium-protoporphyrin IX monomethyl ester cyclase